jgi:hypothetical protein
MVNGGNLRGFAKVRLGCIIVHSVRIIKERDKRAWIALPQTPVRRRADGTGSGWYPTLEITNPAILAQVRTAVLDAWQARQTDQPAPPAAEPCQTKVHRVERTPDPRQQYAEKLAKRFDQRAPDDIRDFGKDAK